MTLVTSPPIPPPLTYLLSLWLAPDGPSPVPLSCPDVHLQSDKAWLGSSWTLGNIALAS